MSDDKNLWLDHIRRTTMKAADSGESVAKLTEILELAKSVTAQVFGNTPAGIAALPEVIRELLAYDYEDDRHTSHVQPTLFEDDEWLHEGDKDWTHNGDERWRQ